MGLRDAKSIKGARGRIPFLGLVTVVTAIYYFEPMEWRNAKRMQMGGMQIIGLLHRVYVASIWPSSWDYPGSMVLKLVQNAYRYSIRDFQYIANQATQDKSSSEIHTWIKSKYENTRPGHQPSLPSCPTGSQDHGYRFQHKAQ
jgi:hypothetical protein